MTEARMTLGQLRSKIALLQRLPDHFVVMVSTPELDFDFARLQELDVLEGDTTESPGSVCLTLTECEKEISTHTVEGSVERTRTQQPLDSRADPEEVSQAWRDDL